VRSYTPEELAAVATQTAQELGLEAVRWWQDENDPWRLEIEAETQLRSGRTVSALLTVLLRE
jgi:hypothetical protein